MNVSTQKSPRRVSILFSLTMLCLFFAFGAYGSYEARWGWIFAGLWQWLVALLIWSVWITHLAFMLLKHNSGSSKRWLLFVILIVASFVVGGCASGTAQIARAREVRRALDAGLREDCMRLLRDWPAGKVRLSEQDVDYSNLPASIRMLQPVYVTNDSISDTDIPPNIGICKNGFGGFADGVRVFKNDEDAGLFKSKTVGRCERIAPGVYFWLHPT